jgi:hypothetical protein
VAGIGGDSQILRFSSWPERNNYNNVGRTAGAEGETGMTEGTELIVQLEDHGQDFLEFDVDKDNVIIEARPFQGWLWRGRKILQGRIRRGMKLKLQKPGEHVLTLNYPVRAVLR